MAYGFNPIALQVQQANLGQVAQQNADKQIAYDNANIAQQSSFASLAKARQDAEKQAKLSQLVQSGEINLSTPEGIAEYALYDPRGAQSLASMYKSTQEASLVPDRRGKLQAETGYTQRRTQDIETDNQREAYKANVYAQNAQNAMANRNRTANVAEQNALTKQLQFRLSVTKDHAKAVQDGAELIAAAPPEQKAMVAAKVQQDLINMGVKKAVDFDPNNPEDIANIDAIGNASLTAKAKSKAKNNTNAASYNIPNYTNDGGTTPSSANVDKLRLQEGAIQSLERQANQLADMVEKYGVRNVPDNIKREYERRYNQMQFTYKEARKLGALQVAEIDLMAKGLPNPASAQSLLDKISPFVSNTDKTMGIPARLRSFATDNRQEFNDTVSAFGYKPILQKPPQGGGGNPPAQGGANVPKIGAIEDGHRFKGGNPADPNSWEAVN